MQNRYDYVKEYINQYKGEFIDQEVKYFGKFLFHHVRGRVLDLGCGPTLHIWTFFMIQAKRIEGIDVVHESLKVFKDEIKHLGEYKAYEEMIKHDLLDSLYKLENQIAKISRMRILDFTKPLPLPHNSYDVAIFTYSLGCVKNIEELDVAIKNAYDVLKTNGLLIIINTNGTNSSLIIPEYTWQGIPQKPSIFINHIKSNGFISPRLYTKKVNNSGLYKYNQVYIITALKHIYIITALKHN